MRKKIIFILLLVVAGASLSVCQQDEVTSEQYEQLFEESGLDDTKRRLRLREKYIPKFEEMDAPSPRKRSFGGAILLKLIAYSLVIALVFLILYLLLDNVRSDKKVTTTLIELDDEIEHIDDVDADGSYRAAVAAKNYRLAIRMHFIKCLQVLTAKEYIQWEKEKTNRNYFREISDSDVKYGFREIATLFEQVWYTDVEIDVNLFQNYDQRFVSFLNKLR